MRKLSNEEKVRNNLNTLRDIYIVDLDKREENECIFSLEKGITIFTGTLNNDILIDFDDRDVDVIFNNVKLDGGGVCSFETVDTLSFVNLESISDEHSVFKVFANTYNFINSSINNCYLEGKLANCTQGSSFKYLSEKSNDGVLAFEDAFVMTKR